MTEIEDTCALLAPPDSETAPGSYPFWWPIRHLITDRDQPPAPDAAP